MNLNNDLVNIYRPLSEASEGYVFTGICLLTGWGRGCLVRGGGCLTTTPFPSHNTTPPPPQHPPPHNTRPPPPGGRSPGNMVNARAVRNLLECIPVWKQNARNDHLIHCLHREQLFLPFYHSIFKIYLNKNAFQ